MNLMHHDAVIFTDGASRGNPGPGGFAAIIIFPEGENNDRGNLQPSPKKSAQTDSAGRATNSLDLVELGGREEYTTNNRMELTAAIEAFSRIQGSTLSPQKGRTFRIVVCSDSSYLINGITKWIHGWQKNNWKTAGKKDVENRDLWKRLLEINRDKEIEWRLVAGHAGVAGNARCDEIATAFADGKPVKLYSGLLSGYPVKGILDFSEGGRVKKKAAARARARAAAYSYVSSVGGVVAVHKTWAECEKRVKGKRGAKHKKAFSSEEERLLIREWQPQ